jgi:hypothetical protein
MLRILWDYGIGAYHKRRGGYEAPLGQGIEDSDIRVAEAVIEDQNCKRKKT